MTTHLRLGVVAAIDPTSTLAVVAAEVLRHELASRLGPLQLDLRTTEPNTHPLQRTPWLPWRASAWPDGFDGLIVDTRIAALVRPGTETGSETGTGPVVVETDLWSWSDQLVALFASQVDDVALDVRTRMLAHLGVLGDAGSASANARDHLPLSALDRYVVARATDTDDAVESALARGVGVDRSPVVRELDAVAQQIGAASPEAGAHEIRQLRDRIALLELALAELQEERAGWLDALDNAAATQLVLERRRDEAALSTAPSTRARP